MLVVGGRVGLAQGWSVSQVDGRAIQQERAAPQPRQGFGDIRDQILENTLRHLQTDRGAQARARPAVAGGIGGKGLLP